MDRGRATSTPDGTESVSRPEPATPAATTTINASTEMRVFLGDSGSAVMRFSESRHAFSLDLILVPSECRSTGLGTELILRLLAIADAVGKPVHTTARPIGQSNPEILERLVRYYERFGFASVDRGFRTVHMKRPARNREAGR